MFFRGEYDYLSNFYPSPIMVPVGKDLWPFPTVENAYQATKSSNIGDWRRCQMLTPGQAKRYGRLINLRPNWDHLKLPIMEELIRIKFTDPELRFLLNHTGDIPIIEDNNWGDTFWGVYNGHGENHLGKILMHIRSLNREENKWNKS